MLLLFSAFICLGTALTTIMLYSENIIHVSNDSIPLFLQFSYVNCYLAAYFDIVTALPYEYDILKYCVK